MNRMVQAHNRLSRASGQRNIPTPQEQALLDKQQHYDFSELSQAEQQQLKSEMDSMWGQIPAHLQEKAKGLAGIN